MATVEMTCCAGGEHITLTVTDEQGTRVIQTTRTVLEGTLPGASEPRDVAVIEAVKVTLKEAEAKTFADMKSAVETADFAAVVK